MTLARRLSLTLVLAGGAGVLLAGPALAAPSAQDTTWLQAAHQYNLTEIAAGTSAQTKAASTTVKDLGQMFITDHTAGDSQLQVVAQQLGVTLPTAPNATQQAELAQAAATSGTGFDALFYSQQTAGHRQALAAGSTELASGSDTTVLALAKATAPVVQHHLNELLADQGLPTSASAGTGGQAASSDRPLGVVGLAAGLVLVVGAGSVMVRRSRGGA